MKSFRKLAFYFLAIIIAMMLLLVSLALLTPVIEGAYSAAGVSELPIMIQLIKNIDFVGFLVGSLFLVVAAAILSLILSFIDKFISGCLFLLFVGVVYVLVLGSVYLQYSSVIY